MHTAATKYLKQTAANYNAIVPTHAVPIRNVFHFHWDSLSNYLCTCTECNQYIHVRILYSLIYSSGLCSGCVCKKRQRMRQHGFSMKITIWPVANELWKGSIICELCYLSEEKKCWLVGCAHSKNYDSSSPCFVVGWPLVEIIIISLFVCQVQNKSSSLLWKKCAIWKVIWLCVHQHSPACCK